MESIDLQNESTCLLCYEERQIFILPKCDHENICWRCCMNMIKMGVFECPFCKDSLLEQQMIIFVTLQEMKKYSYTDIIQLQKLGKLELFKSEKNSNYFYTNTQIAQKMQYQTSYNCPLPSCDQQCDNLNQLKKHLDIQHQRQYCDICLTNRKCILSQQILYTASQFQRHIKSGQYSDMGDLVMFHPTCDFCKTSFYDIDEFKRHLDHKHQKCHHCQKNSEELKYVYYRDYDQAERHFRKTHHICEIGQCINTKIENVFVSEQALQEHIARKHKKSKKVNDKPIVNMLLGFNKQQGQSTIQWDNIGKNYKQLFNMVEKHFKTQFKLTEVDHKDAYIDIRDFYNEMTKKTHTMSLNQIKEKALDRCDEMRFATPNSISLDHVDIFRPLEMMSQSRLNLQRFLHQLFDRKVADLIIDKFFFGRQAFLSYDQYFNFIKTKMVQQNKIAYFYAFPQLLRFFKNQNPTKALMDEFYSQSLRQLKVKKQFIIHKQSKYSQVLLYMKDLIEKQIQERDKDGPVLMQSTDQKELSVDKYLTYIKDMNVNYYIKNQEQIFFVPKDKITNLYHMINKCKVKDFLKMNWLLKIGFNNQAYKIIQKDFYYKKQQQCPEAMRKFTIQQLAYLYSYCIVCLEAIYQKTLFKKNKENPSPIFLSDILKRISRSSSHLRLNQIQNAEKKSLTLDYKLKQTKNKGVIVNERQHPSLLDRGVEIPDKTTRPPDKKNQQDFPSFGTIRPRVWKGPVIKTNISNTEEYPSLCQNTGPKKKIQQQDFPSFSFKPIALIGKQKKKEKHLNNKTMGDNIVGWGNSNFVPSQWNQQDSMKSWQKRLQEEQKRKKKRQKLLNQKYQENYPSLGLPQQKVIPQSKQQQDQKQIKKPQSDSQEKQEPMTFIKPKKTNRIDEWDIPVNQNGKKKKQNKNNKKGANSNKTHANITQNKNNNDSSDEEKKVSNKKNKKQQSVGLFQEIQKQQKKAANFQKNKEKALTKSNLDTEHINKNKRQSIVLNNLNKNKPRNIYDSDDDQKPVINNSDFPELAPVKSSLKKLQQDQIKKKQKKTKMRFDMTSSQQEEKPSHSNKKKKQQQFQSISQSFSNKPISKNQQKIPEQKLSSVNQIINASKVQKVENQIVVKRGKKGKKVIIERVNLFG